MKSETDEKKEIPLEPGWRLVLNDMGLSSENVLRRAELPGDLLARENTRLSISEYFRFWNALDAEAADPHLPIRLVEAISTEAFHPPVFAALCSPNLSIALKRLAEYKRLVAPMHLIIEENESALYVGMEWDDPSIVLPVSLAAAELAFMTRLARIGTREHIEPLKVECLHPMEPQEAYTEFFGVAPSQAARQGVTFRAADAQRPFLTASETLWATFQPELRRRLVELTASATPAERVRSALLEGLPSGQTSIQATARRLGVSARTLQRSLKQEGTSYKSLVKETRERLARHYVTNTKLAYAEISFLIGFEEPSSFFRAFREWTGKTPESVRLAAHA